MAFTASNLKSHLIVVALTFGVFGSIAQAGMEYHTIAASGMSVTPRDDASGAFLDTLGAPAISPGGNWIALAATSRISSVVTSTSSIWRWNGSTLKELAREGDSASGSSQHMVSLGDPQVVDTGLTAFYAKTDAIENGGGLWKASAGNLTEIVKEGDVVDSASVSHIDSPISLNQEGDVAYRCDLIGPSATQQAIIRVAAGGKLDVVRTGDNASWDRAPESYYGSYGANSAGSMEYWTTLTYPAFSTLGSPVIDEGGSMYFAGAAVLMQWGPLQTINTGTPAGAGLYLSGVKWQIVSHSDHIPDWSAATQIGAIDEIAYTPVWLACTTTLASSPTESDRAVVELVSEGEYRFVAREGDPAPGTGQTFSDFSAPAVDAGGQLAFQALLADGRHSLWVEDSSHLLHLVALEGATLDGDPRTVQTILFNGRQGMSRDGVLAFTATFTDSSSAVFTAQYREPVLAVPPSPEPNSPERVRHTMAAHYTLRGTTSGRGTIVALRYKLGNSPWRTVKGSLNNWKLALSLHLGKNRVQLMARDDHGVTIHESLMIVRDKPPGDTAIQVTKW